MEGMKITILAGGNGGGESGTENGAANNGVGK